MKESEAIEFLRSKFTTEGYAVIPQVPNGTGANKRRTADAIMVQLWPSRGLSFTGVEYKRTLGDWRRELQNVDKQEEIGRFCKFWVVLAPKGIIPVDEVPPTWGLWEIGKDGKLYRTRPPPVRKDIQEPTMSFFCGILRAAERYDPSLAALKKTRDEAFDRGVRAGEERAKHFRNELENLKRKVEEFEQASGINIRYGWAHDRVGPALKRYMENPDFFLSELRRVADVASRTQEEINQILESANEGNRQTSQ